jgi:hypothetical protein
MERAHLPGGAADNPHGVFAMPRLVAATLCAALLNAGCFEIFNTGGTVNPDPSINLLGGTWRSSTDNADALLSGCANFSWTATEGASGNVVGAGAFSATCFGNLQVTGSARATQSGSTINWTANGVANGGPLTDCAITLSGTAIQNGDDLVITYAGDTCVGAVSGTETLRRS